MDGDLKLTFINKALTDYMKEVSAAMEAAIQKTDAIDTKTLLQSIHYKVYQQTAQGNADLSFAEWGRFVDMGVGKGHPLGGIKNMSKLIERQTGKRKAKKRKPKKIYSPIVWGKLNGLYGDLSYGFTEETIASLKKELTNNGQSV